LVDLQVVHAAYYKEEAHNRLLLPARALPFVRGRILDRRGVVLVSEEPSWDVMIDYGLLAGDEKHMGRLVRELRRSGRYGQGRSADGVRRALEAELDQTWSDLAAFAGEPTEAVRERGRDICERVQRIRESVRTRRGFDAAVREERMKHAILSGLDDQEQVQARITLVRKYPWLSVADSTHREYHDALALSHILGRVGPVDAEDIRNDPRADDSDGKYLPNEVTGKTGVECAAESLLRGRRGRIRMNLAGRVLESEPPASGLDVKLTIRADLQRRLYDAFGEYLTTADNPELIDSTGGAVVVLDIPAREVLAMVSYPSYDPGRFVEDYDSLRADTLHMPLRFRAVANQYAPGSIAKPLACLAGLITGRIGLETRFNCTGYRFPGIPNKWRCWRVSGSSARKAHGLVNVVEAIEGSCNVFMYHVGEEVGTEALTEIFDRFGLGCTTGIGLPEEATGVNPTPEWLLRRGGRVSVGTGRNLSIGQGEVLVTPLQAANLFAEYASGIRRPVTLVRGLRDGISDEPLPGSTSHWQAVREGLFRVVNRVGGTAYRYARYEGPGFRICGKTGSATTPVRPLSYHVRYVDEQGHAAETIVPAGSRKQAVDDFKRSHPNAIVDLKDVVKYEWWPPDDEKSYSHAWFGGYLQAVDEDGEPRWDVEPRIAFVVLVEYGGSGSHSSGPFAKSMVPLLRQVLGPDLDPDGVPDPPVAGPGDDASHEEVSG
jgi:penicillin-binding protein 2